MSHLGVSRNPQSSARRDHIHGPLVGLNDTRSIWPGVWALVKGTAAFGLCIGAFAFLLAFVTGGW